MKKRFAYLAVAVGFALVFISTEKAQAIPAFARLYKTECSTCHTIFPDRNAFGDAFRKNSYVWPGNLPEQVEENTQYTATSEKKKGKDWLVTIPDQIPISLWVNHDFIVNKDKMPQVDLGGETELELFTAGNFRGKAGWFAEYNFAPDHDIGEVYIQFRHLFGSPVNIKAGKFKPKLSLWKSNDSATISSYGYNDMVVGVNPTTTPPTTGNPFTIDREQGGGEINSLIGNRIFVAVGALTPPEKTRNGPDLYAHLSVRIGGTDFAGKSPAISLVRSSTFDDLALTLGAFGYFGSSSNFLFDEATNRNNKYRNDFYRMGLETELLYKQFRFRMNGIFGEDKDPQGPGGLGRTEKSLFFMAQGQYIFMQNLLAAFRYEHQDIDHEGITRRYIPSVTYAPWQNIRVALEYAYMTQPNFIIPHLSREYTCRVTFAY